MRKKSTKEDERGKYKRGRQRRSERDTQTNREQLMESTLRDLSSDWQGSHPLYTLRASQTGSSQGSLSNACFCIMGLGLCFLMLPGFILRAFVWSSSQTFPNQKQNKREWERGSRGGREKMNTTLQKHRWSKTILLFYIVSVSHQKSIAEM